MMKAHAQSWLRTARLLMWLACPLLWTAMADGTTLVLKSGDAQTFADAVAQWGGTGGELTILLPRGDIFSVQNATFVDAPGPNPFTTGTLTIRPTPDVRGPYGQTILDVGMRKGAFQINGSSVPLTNAARINLQDITLINMCEQILLFDVATWTVVPTGPVSLFDRPRLQRTQYWTNVTQYLRHAVQQAARPAIATIPKVGSDLAIMNTYQIVSDQYTIVGTLGINMTIKSLADPDDSLLSMLKAQGRMMTPRHCNASVTRFIPDMLEEAVPGWLVSDTAMLQEALLQAVQAQPTFVVPYRGPGVIMIIGMPQPGKTLKPYTVAPLQRALMLAGPKLVSSSTVRGSTASAGNVRDTGNGTDWIQGTIDLTGVTDPFVPIGDGGMLFIWRLRLKGLATRPLPLSQASFPTHISVFPLSAFPLASLNASATELDSVAIELPPDDYKAVLYLALRQIELNGSAAGLPVQSDCLPASAGQAAAALATGFTTFVAGGVAPDTSTVYVTALAGWGLKATAVTFESADPFLPFHLWSACQPVCEQDGIAGVLDEEVAIALCTLGGVLALALVAAWGLWLHHRRALARAQARADTPEARLHAVLDSPSVPSVEKLSEKNAQLDTISDSTRDASAREGQGAGFPAACSAGGAPTDLHSDSEGLQGSPSARMEDRTSSSPHAGEGLGAGHIAVGLGAAHAASGTETGVGVGPGVGMEGNQQREASVRAGSEAGTSTSAMNTSTHPRSMIRRLVSEISNENNMVQILAPIGTGTWGVVWKGQWRGLQIALKTLTFEVSDMPAGTEGAHRASKQLCQHQAVMEAAVAASIDHANVVRTYHYDVKELHTETVDALEQSGLQIQFAKSETNQRHFKLYLIQELCLGSLATAFGVGFLHDPETRKIKSERVIIELLLDVSRGLEYLHKRNIVHGDMKPGNILLNPRVDGTDRVIAKLSDFGLSARLGMSQTHVSNFCSGTPFYVAPEVVHECRTSPAADVFSFGVIMWQLWTGQTPYDCKDGGEQYVWNPAFPAFVGPNRPSHAFDILTQNCLLRQPNKRPTASQIITVLQTILMSATS